MAGPRSWHCSAKSRGKIVMLIPPALIELNETHPALRQPPRQQAIRGVRAGLARIRPVHLKRARGSFERSINSGTDVCIRYAISYCAMRVSISGSP